MKRDPIAETLANVAPARDGMFDAPRYTDAVGELARALARTDVRRRRRPARVRARWRIAIAVAVVVVVPVASAVGYQLSAHTGLFGAPGMTENDTSEWLRADAPDFGDVAAKLIPDLPLPRGASWQAELARQVEQGQAEPALVQVTGVRATFEAYARCTWVGAWTSAFKRADQRAALRAAAVIEESATWPATVATDGGGVIEHIRSLAGAAAQGDPRPLRRELTLNCSGFTLAGVR
jgi:hypothetical protein